jgi:hypothetical protein
MTREDKFRTAVEAFEEWFRAADQYATPVYDHYARLPLDGMGEVDKTKAPRPLPRRLPLRGRGERADGEAGAGLRCGAKGGVGVTSALACAELAPDELGRLGSGRAIVSF